jgi:hypothetical protein
MTLPPWEDASSSKKSESSQRCRSWIKPRETPGLPRRREAPGRIAHTMCWARQEVINRIWHGLHTSENQRRTGHRRQLIAPVRLSSSFQCGFSKCMMATFTTNNHLCHPFIRNLARHKTHDSFRCVNPDLSPCFHCYGIDQCPVPWFGSCLGLLLYNEYLARHSLRPRCRFHRPMPQLCSR